MEESTVHLYGSLIVQRIIEVKKTGKYVKHKLLWELLCLTFNYCM